MGVGRDMLPPAEVLDAYGIHDASLTLLGAGNINDTLLVTTPGRRFILQRLNAEVFPSPQQVIDNFVTLSAHLRKRARSEGLFFLTAQPVLTVSDAAGFIDAAGAYWRAQSYVEHEAAGCHRITAKTAGQLGRTLASFHRLTADLPPALLAEPLPDFHRTPVYLERFDRVCQRVQTEDAPLVRVAIDWTEELRSVAGLLEEQYRQGIIGRRVIHGDPKLDNVIFSREGMACGFFDLDTTGPGLLHYDLGDCLRSACNRQGEDTSDVDQVSFGLDIGAALVESYCREAGATFSAGERSLIYEAVLVISFELGVRFLTDHLQGNCYFTVHHHGENLVRALGQLRLARDIREREKEIRQALAG